MKKELKKYLLIVESPSKIKTISKYLGPNYIIKACYGHIADLAKTGQFNLGIDLDNNFKPKYITMPDKMQVLSDMINVTDQVDMIYLAPDPDREGSAISFHLQERLKSCGKPIKRITFNAITKPALEDALKNAHDIDMNLFHAQEARRMLDRIVGFMVSPFLMNSFGPKLSAGRVQSVAVRMIVDREKEIKAFVPEEFWNIYSSLSKDGLNVISAKLDAKIGTKVKADAVLKTLIGNNNDTEFVVKSVIAQDEPKKPPSPLETATLQQLGSKVHGLAADATMKAAQGLYEAGLVTYIRTDSVRADPAAITDVRAWLTNNNHPIPAKPNTYKTKEGAQDAHECIRPTDLKNSIGSTGLTQDERKIYDLIWKYFVASQMNPAIYSTLEIKIESKTTPAHTFRVSGKALKKNGYLDILGIGASTSFKIDIPDLKVNDVLKLVGTKPVTSEQKFTKPSPRFNESDLIEDLKKKQIGRPATYAEILNRIQDRNYVEKKGNVYYPTDLGIKINDILVQYFPFMEYKYTANLELALDKIAEGEMNHVTVLKEFFDPFKEQLSAAYSGQGGVTCEKCGMPMATRVAKASGDKFLGCTNYPKCKNTKSIAKN